MVPGGVVLFAAIASRDVHVRVASVQVREWPVEVVDVTGCGCGIRIHADVLVRGLPSSLGVVFVSLRSR